MNISDRIKMQDILSQFSKFNGNEFKILSVDVKKDPIISFLEGYEMVDSQNNHFTPMVISDEQDEKGNLSYLDRIHEILVLGLDYIIIEKDKKKYHVYSGCSIKTYPGEVGTCFLNFRDNSGAHIKGIPINEILTIDYNDEQKSIVVTFRNKKPAFRYSWLSTENVTQN